MRRPLIIACTACVLPALAVLGPSVAAGATGKGKDREVPVPPGAIQHIMVIDIENEGYAATFGNPASYLSQTLVPQGVLLQNFYATGHDQPGQLRRSGLRPGPRELRDQQ